MHHFQIAGAEDRLQCFSEKFIVVVARHDEQVVPPPNVLVGGPLVPQGIIEGSRIERVKVPDWKIRYINALALYASLLTYLLSVVPGPGHERSGQDQQKMSNKCRRTSCLYTPYIDCEAHHGT